MDAASPPPADGHPYDTRFKVLYSTTGLYFLMEGTDRKLTATMAEDFMDLWNEDVFEVFLWTDERYPVYFEYEISPLNHELPILVPNFGGQFLGWRPWHFERDRLTRKATAIIGGPKEPHASIEGWRAEFFIPYTLLKPLQNVPPKAGTRWRANFYRMDHDDGKTHAVGLGPRRGQLPRVSEVRRAAVRGSVKTVRPGGLDWGRRLRPWLRTISRQCNTRSPRFIHVASAPARRACGGRRARRHYENAVTIACQEPAAPDR